MQDVLNEEFDVNPDAKIEEYTPQPASADDTPDDTASPVPPEGLHFSFPSEEEIPPASMNAPAVPEAYLPVYNGQPVRVDAGDVERVTIRSISRPRRRCRARRIRRRRRCGTGIT